MIFSASQSLKIGGLLLVATPDSACQNKHMQFVRDWYFVFAEMGFKKLSYAKEKHFHGMSLVKVRTVPMPRDQKLAELCAKLYILHDKHDLNTLEQQSARS